MLRLNYYTVGDFEMPPKKVIEIVLDVETTGLDYTKERMVEFAGLRLENGKIKAEFQTLINPEQHIRKSSMAVHGITEEMVKDAPTEAEIMPKILEFIGDYPIVAHNAIFDYSYINEAAKRTTGKPITNPMIDSQAMFKEVYPDLESCGMEALSYPALKKLYKKKYAWQMKQIENVEYLFERFLRIQGAVSTMQAELQDLKSIFKLYFEQGGEPITSPTGETLVYHHKQGFNYDFSLIKDTLEEIGALEKAVKLNTGFIDRLINGRGLDEETRDKLRNARIEISTNKNIQVIKPDRH